MDYAQGMVITSLKGHDKGKCFVILKTENSYVFLIDGKNRKKHNPKKKNSKHVRILQHYMPEVESLSDKTIRKQLNQMRDK